MAAEKVALVTGANKGIGFEVARQLAERNFKVILTARNVENGNAACERLKSAGGDVQFIELDVAHRTVLDAAVERVQQSTAKLDVLVNNAGILEDGNVPALEADPDVLMRSFATNAMGPFLLVQRLWPLLANGTGGRVINVSSGMAGLSDMGGGYAGYRLSKTALNAVTRVLATELAPHGVTVNSVCPGWVRTDMGGSDARLSVAEGADTIVWLATEAPQDLTGSFLRARQPIPW